MAAQNLPIIDAHIHLFPQAETDTLAWMTPDHHLAKQCSVDEFRAASGAPQNLRGFVFLETDRINDKGAEWKHALAEIEWLARIVKGEPRDGEGHSAQDAPLCLGIVPWAPMNLGRAKMIEYLDKAEQAAGPAAWPKIKGFRYLLQDKDIGAGVTPEFIESMKLLGERGFTFDAGIDQHRRGRAQLEELVAMIDHAYEGVDDEKQRLKFIINHCCKPNLEIIRTADPSFIAWRSAMFTLAKCESVYMKLSGFFAEMPPALSSRSPEEIFEAVQPWLAVVLAAFGPSRIMFASDWPVCTIGVPEGEGELGAWKKWRAIVERLCDMASLSEEDQKMIWAGTAIKAYGLDA